MLLPAGLPISFSAAFNNPTPADVAMSVWDDSAASPVLVSVAAVMAQVGSTYVYRGKFTPLAGKNYIVVMAVYTDNTFTTINSSFVPVTQFFIAQYLTPVPSLVGLVNCQGE